MTGNDDGRGGLQAGEAEDHDTPPGTAHVYIEAAPGLCFCSRPRFSGWHVGRDCGHPDVDIRAAARELDLLEADVADRLAKVRRMLLGRWGA
jgi:hypothetical protein